MATVPALAVDGAVSAYGEQSSETRLALDMLLQVLVARGDTGGADAVRARVERIREAAGN